MSPLLRVLAVASALSTVSSLAIAGGAVVQDGYVNQFVPTSARIEGGTTGYGGALSWTANPIIGLTLGYNGGNVSWSNNLKISGSTYDLDMKNKTTYLNVDIRPWGTSENKWAEAFYVSAGIAHIDNKYDIERDVSNGRDFSVNNKKFTAAENVKLDGKMNYNNTFAPYLGLGYSPKLGENWGLFAEAGAYYTRNPKVELTASGTVRGGESKQAEFEQAVRNEAYDIGNKTKYEWLPVGKVGVNFYW